MNIGILTGGGDCPGLNAVIRAVVVKAAKHNGWRVTGILEGWRGLMQEGLAREILVPEVSGILGRGGTIIKTSRTNPGKTPGGYEEVLSRTKKLGLDAVIAIGGEDTLGVASALHERGLNVVGVPKTIDNDIVGTDYCFGFDTAVNTVMEAIDRVRTTTESHKRVMVVEVMGRHAGWIALQGGMAGGADEILLPERKSDLKEICELIRRRHEGGKDFSIVVVAEGAQVSVDGAGGKETMILQDAKTDEFGHVRLGGIGQTLSEQIEKCTGYETRMVMLGHVQRGGSPSAFDRYLCTRYGIEAVRLIERKQFGRMVCLRGNQVLSMPLSEVAGRTRTVSEELFQEAALFFG